MKHLISILALSLLALTTYGQSQGVSVRAFNGSATNLSVISNSIVLIKRAPPFAQIPYTNAIGIIGRVISNAVAGDVVYVGPGTHIISNSIYIPVGVTVKGAGRSTVFLNQIHRGGTITVNKSAMMVLRDNVTLSDFSSVGVPTVAAQQNAPFFGTIDYDATSQPTFTNVLLQNLFTTNATTGWYCRQTNFCSGVLVNCEFNSTKLSGFVAEGNHYFDYFDCRFRAYGPNTISGDSSEYAANGFRALGGTNNFHNFEFSASNPKTEAGVSVTNTSGLFMYELTPGNIPVVNLYGGRIWVKDTNANAVTFATVNGLVGPAGVLNVYSSGHDRTNTFGSINYVELPLQASQFAVYNTNVLIVAGESVGGTFYRESNTRYTNASLFKLDRVATPAPHWELLEEFDSAIFTNANTVLTNGPYYDVSDGGLSLLTINFAVGWSNRFVVIPGDLVVNGIGTLNAITNLDNAGSGVRLVQADANGKLSAVIPTNAVGSGVGSGTLTDIQTNGVNLLANAAKINVAAGQNITVAGSISGTIGTVTLGVNTNFDTLNVGTLNLTNPVPLAAGGTGESLSDPNAHRLFGWDDTDGDMRFFTIGANLSYDPGTDTLSASGGGVSFPITWGDVGNTTFLDRDDATEVGGIHFGPSFPGQLAFGVDVGDVTLFHSSGIAAVRSTADGVEYRGSFHNFYSGGDSLAQLTAAHSALYADNGAYAVDLKSGGELEIVASDFTFRTVGHEVIASDATQVVISNTTAGLAGIKLQDNKVTVTGAFLLTPDTLTDAATIATDASLGNHFRVTLGGNRTLGNPTNPTDAQRVTWEVIQDGTGSRTLAMDTKFAFGTDITGITLTTTASKRDFITAIYNLAADKWYVVGFVRGY